MPHPAGSGNQNTRGNVLRVNVKGCLCASVLALRKSPAGALAGLEEPRSSQRIGKTCAPPHLERGNSWIVGPNHEEIARGKQVHEDNVEREEVVGDLEQGTHPEGHGPGARDQRPPILRMRGLKQIATAQSALSTTCRSTRPRRA